MISSLSHFWIIWRFPTRKKLKKSKFNFVQYDSKLYKDNVQGLKKLKQTTFVDFSSILGQKLHFEKKSWKNSEKNTKNAEFPKFLTKNTLKNSKFYFVQYGQKMHKNVLWGLKKPPKSIFNDFQANLDKKTFLKKKLKKCIKIP